MIEDDTATIAILDYVEAAQELVLAIYAGEYDPDPVSVTH